jgi:hypothetical protein
MSALTLVLSRLQPRWRRLIQAVNVPPNCYAFDPDPQPFVLPRFDEAATPDLLTSPSSGTADLRCG